MPPFPEMARLGVASALLALVGGCGGGGDSGSGIAAATNDSALLAQRAAAAPPQSCSYSHVWVTVSAIRVLREDTAAPQWQDITLATPRRIDLLAGGAGVLEALGVAPLQPGVYRQLRLVLAADPGADGMAHAVEPAGASPSPLRVPGGESAGVKLVGDITVRPGTVADVVLEAFDPCTAIVRAGNSGAYNLKPLIDIQVKPIVQAAPEAASADGSVILVPGGGHVLATVEGATWTLRRFDSSGNPVGPVASITIASEAIAPSFAALTGGGYAAIWLESSSTPGVYGLVTRAWDASGQALGPATPFALVNPGKLSHPPAIPQLAPLIGGGYVVVWGLPPVDDGVYAQRYDASGKPAGRPVQVVPSATGPLGVTGLQAGGYLVTWGRFDSATGGVQAYSAFDTPLAAVQSAGTNGDGGGPPMPVVRALTGGGAVIAWQAVGQHVLMQQVAPDGTPVTAVQVVDDQTASPVFAVIAIGALPDGGSVIAWTQTDGNVYARRYLANGAPAGPQTRVNLVTTSADRPLGVVVLADGSFTIRWSGAGADGVRRMYSRIFPPAGP